MNERVHCGADPTTAIWRKSSQSGGEGNECVEVADLRTTVGVRDSKDRNGPHLCFSKPPGRSSSPV